MLVKREYANGFKKDICIYKCDRCNSNITIETRYQLAISKPNESTRIKYADLCPRCMKALHRGIKRGKKNG